MAKNYDAIKQDLLNTGMVENVALSDYTTLYGGNNTGGLNMGGKNINSTDINFPAQCIPRFFAYIRHENFRRKRF